MAREYRAVEITFSPDDWDAMLAYGKATCPNNNFSDESFVMAALLTVKYEAIKAGKVIVEMTKRALDAEAELVNLGKPAESPEIEAY